MARGLARHLSRTKPHRDALLRNLASQLLQHGTISSTTPKLKETQRYVERIITIAKHGVLSGKPQSSVPELQSRLYLAGDNSKLLKKLFDEIVPRYLDRNGGYTRILKLEPRMNDRAPQGIIELVDAPVQNKDGELLKGNLKLWLLTKSCMSSLPDIAPLVLKNLKKMTALKSVEQLVSEMGAIRAFILENENVELDQAVHDEFLETMKKQLEEYSPAKSVPVGYEFKPRPNTA